MMAFNSPNDTRSESVALKGPKKILEEKYGEFLEVCNKFREEILKGHKPDANEKILGRFCVTKKLKQSLPNYIRWMDLEYARALILSKILACNGKFEGEEAPFVKAWLCPHTYVTYKFFSQQIPNIDDLEENCNKMIAEKKLNSLMCKKYVGRHWNALKSLYSRNQFIKIRDLSCITVDTFQSSSSSFKATSAGNEMEVDNEKVSKKIEEELDEVNEEEHDEVNDDMMIQEEVNEGSAKENDGKKQKQSASPAESADIAFHIHIIPGIGEDDVYHAICTVLIFRIIFPESSKGRKSYRWSKAMFGGTVTYPGIIQEATGCENM